MSTFDFKSGAEQSNMETCSCYDCCVRMVSAYNLQNEGNEVPFPTTPPGSPPREQYLWQCPDTPPPWVELGSPPQSPLREIAHQNRPDSPPWARVERPAVLTRPSTPDVTSPSPRLPTPLPQPRSPSPRPEERAPPGPRRRPEVRVPPGPRRRRRHRQRAVTHIEININIIFK
ncbi:uncharacterized protein LOC127286122 [Leptopilina boulardi]|uniref:uncharacterized protein LOC127286122 n=1 Tax=Leptopilina boulardi TaxID=63433 RepID=UPI0021F5EDAF|nr:uncharacterized protein LOC127286122 [Leptopilina boulardi]